jgi:hypothetical protein
VSFHPESSGTSEPLGVRRPVELPEVNTEAAGDLAPASDTPSGTDPGSDGASEETGATAPGAGDSRPDEAAAADKTASDKQEQGGAEAREIAVAATPNDGDGDGTGDGMPPDRPKKPVLAAVAIGGAVVLAIPILLIGTGSHEGKKQRTAAAANTVLSGGQQPPPGAYVSTAPSATPTPTPSASASPKHKAATAKKDDAEKRTVSAAKHAAFTGADNVLLKDARSGLCADVPGYGNGSVDGPVNQYHCALGDADNQVWSLGVMQDLKGPGGTPLFVIRNTKDDYCMDLGNFGARKAGTKVTEYYCRPTKGDNQLWYRTHTRGHLYRIRNYASHGLCLGVTGRSHATDKQLEIHKCGSGDEWSWPRGV